MLGVNGFSKGTTFCWNTKRQICFFNNSYKFSELQSMYNNKKLGSCEYSAEIQNSIGYK